MNRLAGAASLYLRQHADNPVDWWPCGDDAFARGQAPRRARARVDRLRGVPLVPRDGARVLRGRRRSPSASTTSSCPIKVDREERPDVDALYMAATQAMNGHGGWPMTVFVHPRRPAVLRRHVLPARPRATASPRFPEVLEPRRRRLGGRAATTCSSPGAPPRRRGPRRGDRSPTPSSRAVPAPGARAARRPLVDALATRFDAADGGFSRAPKFPHPALGRGGARSFVATGRERRAHDGDVTLDAMARGGLFDHVAGGFARYSVDATWTVPHFEKMLSDQALLARAYLRAAAWLGRAVVRVGRAARRSTSSSTTCASPGGFASAIDADAGGVEGAHVVLTATRRAARSLDAPGSVELADAHDRALRAHRRRADLDGACVPRLGATDGPRRRRRRRRGRATRCSPPAPTGRSPPIDDKVLLEWNAMLAAVLAEAGVAARRGPLRATRRRRSSTRCATTHRAGGRWRRRAGDRRAARHERGPRLAPRGRTCRSSSSTATSRTSTRERGRRRPRRRLLGRRAPDGRAARRRAAASSSRTSRPPALFVRAKDVLDGATPCGHLGRRRTRSHDSRWRHGRRRAARARRRGSSPSATRCSTHSQRRGRRSSRRPCLLDEGVEVAVPGPAGAMLAEVAPPRRRPRSSRFGEGPLALLDGRADDRLYVCRHATCEAPVNELGSVAPALAAAARWEAEG